MTPLRIAGIIALILTAIIVEGTYIHRLNAFATGRDDKGRPQELHRAQAKLEFGLKAAKAATTSAEYVQRFQYPRALRQHLEHFVHDSVDAKMRAQREGIAREHALNEFLFLTVNTLPHRKQDRQLPGPLRKALLDYMLARQSAELEFSAAKVGGPMQGIYRNLQRERELSQASASSLSYVRQFNLAKDWAAQKFRETTVNCLSESQRRQHQIGSRRGPGNVPPGLAEHYFAYRFGLLHAEISQLLEIRRFVEGLPENESVFAKQHLDRGIISQGAAELADLERDVVAQDFMLLRRRSTLFTRGLRDRANVPSSPLLQAEFSRLRCNLTTAFARTSLEIEQHLQKDPNGAAARARAIETGANPLFSKKLDLAQKQAWAELDEALLDVMPGRRRAVNLVPAFSTNGTPSSLPHPLQLAQAKLEIANLKADIAQSTAVRAIEVGPTPFGIEAADRRQLARQLGSSGLSYMNEMINRQAQGTAQWIDFLEKMKQTAPLAANENLLSRELGIVDFQTTTRNNLPFRPE